MTWVIWHNPRCGKSRQTLKLLEEAGLEPTVVRYLDEPPNPDELRKVLALLAMEPFDLIRRREPPVKSLGLGPSTPSEILIKAMCEHPILIERPVVTNGLKAALGRPPESVLAIIGD